MLLAETGRRQEVAVMVTKNSGHRLRSFHFALRKKGARIPWQKGFEV